jgi:hypothetical protein
VLRLSPCFLSIFLPPAGVKDSLFFSWRFLYVIARSVLALCDAAISYYEETAWFLEVTLVFVIAKERALRD